MSSRIAQLIDERDILDTIHRFAAGMDLRDREALRATFADEIDVDYTSYRGGEVLHLAADVWVDRVRQRFATMIATQHMLANHRIELDGDEALCRTYLEAQHVALVDGVEDWCLIGGEYNDRLRRTPDGWKIVLKKLDIRWITGNRAILDLPTS